MSNKTKEWFLESFPQWMMATEKIICKSWKGLWRLWRGLKWGCMGMAAIGVTLLALILFLPVTWKLRTAHRIAYMCNSPWKSDLLVLTVRLADSFDRIPSSDWLTQFSSIPPQLRFDVFYVTPPEVQIQLLTLMAEENIRRSPEKKKIMDGLLEKAFNNYFLLEENGREVVNENEGTMYSHQLQQEKGDEWLASLTAEEMRLASEIHRQWFHPGLALRHEGAVWIRPDQLDFINGQFMRFPVFQKEFERFGGMRELFIAPFPGDLNAPDFTRHYETDGLFIAPRRSSCDCRTDVDCTGGQRCRIPKDAGNGSTVTDEHTCCHLMGVLISCQGNCG